MVMLSTRLTGSSTSITRESSRSARSTGVSAPGRSNHSRAYVRETSSRAAASVNASTPSWSRSKNSAA